MNASNSAQPRKAFLNHSALFHPWLIHVDGHLTTHSHGNQCWYSRPGKWSITFNNMCIFLSCLWAHQGSQRHPEATETKALEELSKAAEHQRITSDSENPGISAGSWEELGRCWCTALTGFPTTLPILVDTALIHSGALVLLGTKQMLSTAFEQINTSHHSGTSTISRRSVLPGRLTRPSAQFLHPQGTFPNSSSVCEQDCLEWGLFPSQALTRGLLPFHSIKAEGKKPSRKHLPSLPVRAKTGTNISHCSPKLPFLLPAHCSQGTPSSKHKGLQAAAPLSNWTSPPQQAHRSQSISWRVHYFKMLQMYLSFLSFKILQVDVSVSYTGNSKESALLILRVTWTGFTE